MVRYTGGEFLPGSKDDPVSEDRRDTRPGAVPLSASRIDAIPDELARYLSAHKTKIGDLLSGRYRVLRDLGEGGMGHVFVAENVTIGSHVAVKVLKPELVANEDFRKRFQKEADAIAAVEHQNVVRFYDLVVGDPTFLVMEYIDGPTLSKTLKESVRLEPLRAAELARRLCWGLHAAHKVGVIHRDIKPANIILAHDEEAGEQPKLIDFGVAKTAGRPTDLQLTRQGQIVGTPHYMSPEQVGGGEVDPRSDVYALGCVLYHMLTGRPPFVGNEEYQILRQHMERAPDPPSHIAVVPPAFDPVVLRALAKDPQRRFASTREMAQALAEVIGVAAHERVTAVGHASATRRPRPRGVAVALGAALLAATAALCLGAGWFLRGHRAPTGGAIIVLSEPPGAAVDLDGRAVKQTTPAVLEGVAEGRHVVGLRMSGHSDTERHVAVASRGRAVVEVVLPPISHRVSVATSPAGASVYLDRKLVLGTTPTFMAITEDDFHELRIERAGYEPIVRALTPEDQKAELSFTLEPEREACGYVSVESNGAAQVWIDGVYSGFDTPTLAIRLPVGKHTMELRDSSDAHSPLTQIDLHAGQALHLTLSVMGDRRR